MAKSAQAFRTISEAAEEIGVPQHVLRFWESKFAFIAPLKRAGGRRFYRPQDVVVLKGVRRLLHEEGLTIKGVLRLHKDQGLRRLAAYGDPAADFDFDGEATGGNPGDPAPKTVNGIDPSQRLRAVVADLETAQARLEAVLAA